MRQAPRTAARRAGFTMVELIVVMTIILILLGLSLAGVQRARGKARELKVRAEMSQMSAAINAFKQKYQVSYLPSRIILREDGRYGDNGTAAYRGLELETEAFLKKMWPRMITAGYTGGAAPNSRIDLKITTGGQWTDWFADGTYQSGDAGAYHLEGDQCLVFFLGGLQPVSGGVPQGCVGFTASTTNPTSGTPAGPLYDFPTDRLTLLAGNQYRSNGFLTYLDPFGKVPYAYYSSKNGNDYSNTAPFDCQTLQVQPYYEQIGAVIKYFNRDGFQIICAGKDNVFAGGGLWSAGTGWPAGSVGADDFSNFHPNNLGSGTNTP